MSFKITITDNTDGKVLVNEENAIAIIGAIANGKNIRNIGFISCNAVNLEKTINEAEEVISKIKNEHPEVEVLSNLRGIFKKVKDEDN